MDEIITGNALDVLKTLPSDYIDCCVTSPPYFGIRDCGIEGQIGLEQSPEEYIDKLVEIFREVRRVLKSDGTLWLNIGDSYAGGAGRWGGTKNMSEKQSSNSGSLGQIQKAKPWKHDVIKRKDLIGIPWQLAFALRADGWYLRQDIIWHKPNAMPESVKDRCTKSHEYIFLMSKHDKYYFDNESIKEAAIGLNNIPPAGNKGTLTPNSRLRQSTNKPLESTKIDKRNNRDVWSISTKGFKGAHFATFPEKLVEPCILAGCPEGGIVLDPFIGSGTTAVVAHVLGRKFIGIELNPDYSNIAKKRLGEVIQ